MTKNKGKCKFRISPEGALCEKKVYSMYSDFCLEHANQVCKCGLPATRWCWEYGCKTPLCDENKYCESDHNIKVHIPPWDFAPKR